MAACLDCGADCARTETLCDPCYDMHDAHTTKLQLRLQMAKAQTSRIPLSLTPRELRICVVLLGRGQTVVQAVDHIQARRSSLPFGSEAA